MLPTLIPTIASPSPSDTSARTFGSRKCAVACTIARARRRASPLLKTPLPTNTPSQPSCIISAASAGVAMPPAAKLTTGSRPRRAVSSTSAAGTRAAAAHAARSLGESIACTARHVGGHRARVPHRLHHVARAGLALGADHGRAFVDAPQRLAEVSRAADKGGVEGVFLDVQGGVGGREDFGLVDVVDAKGLQDLAVKT